MRRMHAGIISTIALARVAFIIFLNSAILVSDNCGRVARPFAGFQPQRGQKNACARNPMTNGGH
jgi:hypothetical protein